MADVPLLTPDGHAELDHTGIPGVGGGGGGGGSYAGLVALVYPPVVPAGNTGAAGAANTAYAVPINVPGPMRVRAARFRFTSSGAGAIEWGLFDYAADPTAATKLAGGSSAPGGTGWQSIAAAGGPVLIDPGSYILMYLQPASGTSNIGTTDFASGFGAKSRSSYTWSDTPDLTTGWSDYQNAIWMGLRGDLDASGAQW